MRLNPTKPLLPLPFGWRINAYIHPRWKDIHGNRAWLEIWHPQRHHVVVARINGRFGVRR